MSKFDVNKFFEILSKPKKVKKILNDKGKKYFYRQPYLDEALEDSGHKHLCIIDEGYVEERTIFNEIDELENDFKKLDKGINYSPIFQLRDTPEPDDGLYYYREEYAYVSSKKSKYSFLISADDYNVNINVNVDKIFKNISPKDIKNLSQYPLKQDRKDSHFCKWIILNNKYNWGTSKEKKDIKSNELIPDSLKKIFLPVVENKIEFSKDCGNKPSDIKKVNSIIAILDEKRIKQQTWRPSETKLERGEAWDYVKDLDFETLRRNAIKLFSKQAKKKK
tara:strand:- start:695 stop:1528 length:834 start_codon:yes stop_codon:yes gene_type:complete